MKKTDKKYLLIVRSGPNSLHTEWEDETTYRKNFDLLSLDYFKRESPNRKNANSSDFSEHIPGPKVHGLFHWLNNNPAAFETYKYIGFFDDDIRTNHQNISRLFSYIELLDLQIAQPALTPESNYSLVITRQHESFLHRWSNWIEIMCPIFRSDVLKKCLNTFLLNIYGGGALENLWPRYCDPVVGSIAIIDKIPVIHTRPVGSAGSGSPSDRNSKLKYYRKKLVGIQSGTGGYPTDNICGLTREGKFLHLGELEFLQLLIKDMDNDGIKNHTLINEFGEINSTRNFYLSYVKNARKNFDSVNDCETNKPLSEAILATAIKSSLVIEDLKAI